ncbi:hypothetical protein MMA231_00309 [Asticcacaulis sp. MM231]
MRRHANRMAALFRQRRVIDDKITGIIPHQTVGLLQENGFKRSTFPNAVRDKMMELVIAKLAIAGGHRLDTLAVTRANQACNIGRAQPHPGLMPQGHQEGRQPIFQIYAPMFRHRQSP